jgi:hypothetical protein
MSTVWAGIDELPVLPINTFVTQMGGYSNGEFDGAILNVGYVAPPFVLGTPEEQHAMLNAMGGVTARALGRFQLSRARLAELIGLLQGLADTWDGAEEQIRRQGEDG